MSKTLSKILVSVAVVILLVVTYSSGILHVNSSSVTIRNEGVKLAATLTTPRWKEGRRPAIVLVHESGRVQRQDLRHLSRRLARQGLAVLSYDKRGVAKSTGVFTALTVDNSSGRIEELASDANKAVDFLLEHPAVDPSHIGLVGADQAGWIIPHVAAGNENVTFFIVISGPAVSYGEVDFYRKLTGENPSPYEEMAARMIADRLAGFGGPFGYDPTAALSAVDVPSLWLFGERDDRIPVDASVARLQMLEADSLVDVRVLSFAASDLVSQESGRQEVWGNIIEWLAGIGVPVGVAQQ